MSEASGTTTVVVETPEGAPATVTLDNETGAPIVEGETIDAEPEGESDAVAIARINSETEITTAAIRAETESERIAAEVQVQEDATWLRAELASTQERNRLLETEAADLREQVARLIPPPSEVEAVTLEVVDPTTTDTSATETETSSPIETEAPESAVAEKVASTLEAVAAQVSPDLPPRRKVRMI